MHKLGHIAHSGVADNSCNAGHAVDLRAPEEALEEAKTPVRTELGVSNNQKRVDNVSVSACHHSPHQVVDHCIVFVLSCAIVRMKIHICFPQTVNFEKVVQPTDDCIGPLSYFATLIGGASQCTPNTEHFLGVRKKMVGLAECAFNAH